MSIIPLVTIGPQEFANRHISLRQIAQPVVEFRTVELKKIVADLTDTLNAHRIAVGLAAPQIGMNVQVAVVNISVGKQSPALVLCNPAILSSSGKKDKKLESCMSVPGYGGTVERRDKLTIRYFTQEGEPSSLEARGFLARVIAHEIDHLEGLLYIDHIPNKSDVKKVDLFDRD